MSKTGGIILSVVGVIIALIVGMYAFNAVTDANKVQQIEDRVGAIHFSSSVKKKQCGGGGIDTSIWCTYTVEAPLASISRDMLAAGFVVLRESDTGGATLTGGDPTMTVVLKEYNGTTQLEAKILEDGRTI